MGMNSQKSSSPADKRFMKRALDLAQKGLGCVSPNPMVGCVIVKSGKIIAEGHHKKFGGPHAEINALKKIRFNAKGATMYVTLEPCHHFGKTPPCVDAVIQSGVSRVVMAMRDPNWLTAGKSIKKIKNAGIEVTLGVCGQKAKQLNRFFVKHVTTGLPFVIAKVAKSRDGMIAEKIGQRTQISGKESLAYVQKLRSRVDAVLVGKNTVLMDDPLLNLRDAKKHQPKRVILDSHLSLADKSGKQKLFSSHGGEVILLSVREPSGSLSNQLKSSGVTVITVKKRQGRVDLRDALKKLGNMGVASVLVEGGAEVFSSFADLRLVDEWQVIECPVTIGKKGVPVFLKGSAPRLKILSREKLGRDELCLARQF